MNQSFDARTWVTDQDSFTYPESVYRKPLTGVCFSGGGTRSYAATIGQIRGLSALGLWKKIGYVSGVSGGAWAVVAETFYRGPGRSDDDILGPVRRPDELTFDTLRTLGSAELNVAATNNFRATLESLAVSLHAEPDQIWIRAIGETFLAPFGLHDALKPKGFTWDAASELDLYVRNPKAPRCYLARGDEEHPYPLIHATLNGPDAEPGVAQKVGFEFTPLYCGSPTLKRFESSDEPVFAGGGYVESMAFGGRLTQQSDNGNDGRVAVEMLSPFTLADAVGASSASSTSNRDPRLYPHSWCWPLPTDMGPAARYRFTDGGDLENFGLISLLRRRVTKVVVFINTVWPLLSCFDPRVDWPDDSSSTSRVIDPFLAPLFGAPSDRFAHNTVFPEDDFSRLVTALQDKKHAGHSVMTTMRHAVQDNAWWGLSGGWDVEICWVYNERVVAWEKQLPTVVRVEVERGNSSAPSGPVERFPHYRTQGQNAGALIRLTPEQVNLMSHLSCWNVTANGNEMGALFA